MLSSNTLIKTKFVVSGSICSYRNSTWEPCRTATTPYKYGHKSHILFCGMPILCRLPSLFCPLTDLSRTKLIISYQTCSDWVHLSQWILSIGTMASWSHPVPKSLQWRHNERNSVSNHQPHDCLRNRSFGRRSNKTSKLRVTGPWIHRGPVNSPHKWPVTRKIFPFDDIIISREGSWPTCRPY